MRQTAAALAARGYTLRTGGAAGADQAFLEGAGGPSGQVELFLPWPGFRGWRARPGMRLFERATPEAYRLAEQYHPNWRNLRHAVKSLHARNVHQVLGAALDDPVRFVLCWTPDGSGSGGTGQAIRIAQDRSIPVFDLAEARALARVQLLVRDAPITRTASAGKASAFRDVHGSLSAGGRAGGAA